jgi:hypothetical protein
MKTVIALALLLGLASPALARDVRCFTCEEKTLNWLHTLCDDGSHMVSRFNKLLGRWETTLSEGPRKACTARVYPTTKAVELRCR